ncbi:serine hydrolase domain-containing protein [Sinosporangium siamense]|uniref:Beta-lactamase-related domain-containing protein n=1 Tax=Sinosporangium siamense TaxID=1367973 RepID=A0A919V7V4_9ACTN|nr:serine hydrolase domain-containing protein [Sinosporangium siamense]GII93813.1 hypothetical protein Ssi02_40440 [Sinosporangium siamense]
MFDLPTLLAETAKRLGVTGAQAAYSVGGELHRAATGVADAHGSPVADHTLFQIGSTTKLHTAVLILGLVDEGLIDLDRPVTEHLPELELGEPEWTKALTPRHLLSMSSGIDNGPYDDTATTAEAVRSVAGYPFAFEPGTGFGYSNTSTNVSGLLIERVTGLPWHEALQRRLCGPAGLTDTVSELDELVYRHVALGHTREGEIVRPWTFARGAAPAGSTLCGTAGDQVKFARMLLGGGAPVLSAEAVATLHTPQVDVPCTWFAEKWCAGPYLKIWDGVRVYGHGGTNLAGSSTVVWIPEHDAAMAVTVNTPSRGYPFADAVFEAICAEVLGITKPGPPEPGPAAAVADPGLYTGVYEAYGLRYEVTAPEGRLLIAMTAQGETLTSELLPLGGHRFLPADERIGGYHGWDVAFVPGPDGSAVRFVNGAFPARRTGPSATR